MDLISQVVNDKSHYTVALSLGVEGDLYYVAWTWATWPYKYGTTCLHVSNF